MSIQHTIESKLADAFAPERLLVLNESAQHAGHAPDITGEGETHMRVRIVAAHFSGMNRITRHRAINDLLKDEFDAGLHALAIEAAAPGEQTRW
ncbi:BolA family protein [Rhizobium halophytocola]|uniref:BolA protein n=1 Tax=Rhizobium halophytocola TaxID=735519 RepID=A0ABS4E2K8_9HYPH|nr:BolA family protein [Rhizobium halophytocola]MBP1852194.1 BolA protein [Rhizobium halophytocola]